MESIALHILGCGSALPTVEHWPTSQALVVRGKVFLIDCGEGCQLMLRKQRVSFSRIVALFVSHLHGDHLFGLPGLLGTLALLGRTGTLKIYGPQGIAEFVDFIQSHFMSYPDAYPIEVYEHSTTESQTDFEDPSLKVSTLPLVHRIPTAGYLFEEKCAALHLDKAATDFYKIPLADYPEILLGAPYALPDGRVIPNSHLTRKGRMPRKYAFCTDTKYNPQLSSLVKGVDLLYHESTYLEVDRERAESHFHSTAAEAAKIAQEAGAKRLLLGHYSSRYSDTSLFLKEAQAIFPNTLASYEGMTLEL